MTTVATIDPASLSVSPGGEVRCVVKVRNNGDIVESYRFQVVGDPGQWATVEPAQISLYPAAEGTATVIFRVAKGSRMPAADLPFAVRVMPVERPQFAAAPEGMLRVLPYRETTAEVLPRMSRVFRTARHEVAIDNRGNVPLQVSVSAADPDQALRAQANPASVMVPPGQAIFSTVKLRHPRLLWKGQPATRPFRVILGFTEGPPQMLDATAVQKPLISRGTGRMLALVLAGLVALAAVWFFALKPAVTSAAKDAVAAGGGGGGGGQNGPPQPIGGGGQSPGPSANPTPGTQTPFSRRLATSGGGVRDDSFTVANKTVFLMTDIIVENPQGDAGQVDLRVNGVSMLTLSLANFRDEDYHLVTPVEVLAGQTVQLHTVCQTAGPPLAGQGAGQCRVFALVTGLAVPPVTP
ncbi:MAG TPA: hypothetical protein VKB69_12615 [Micromonosporaceae bacterium]|nr:hypothetical protein [Micromonosporaceae bacterium]